MTVAKLEEALEQARAKLKFEGFRKMDTYTNTKGDCFIETWSTRHEDKEAGIIRKGRVMLMWAVDTGGGAFGALPGHFWQMGPGKFHYPDNIADPENQLSEAISAIVGFVTLGPPNQ
jgi:hypothetical protein